jgi:hypothetical protein
MMRLLLIGLLVASSETWAFNDDACNEGHAGEHNPHCNQLTVPDLGNLIDPVTFTATEPVKFTGADPVNLPAADPVGTVPEPGTLLLVAIGSVAAMVRRRTMVRRRNK